ncbi:MAG TPA: dihydrodipicolinate synthase family protein [Actinomycetota bacterium]|nr:dihydrodipicolinate synthase family protein [Actinomycetota bacterium]
MLHGVLAAALTPLRDGGEALDEEAFGPLVAFLEGGGVDGILALGTTGEGIMLSVEERRRVAELFLQARPPGFDVAVHCGAQTTADTCGLAAHAAEAGADAVAVIAPPYYAFDAEALYEHFLAAARACTPLPFYVYEFAARSGYSVSPDVVLRLRDAAPNLAGLKVSDSPMDAVRPYLIDGLDVFVGQEPLAIEAMAAGGKGCVSGLATAFPEVVADLVHERSPAAHAILSELRSATSALPFIATLKVIAAERGVPVREDVRRPGRTLSPPEREAALAALRKALVAD